MRNTTHVAEHLHFKVQVGWHRIQYCIAHTLDIKDENGLTLREMAVCRRCQQHCNDDYSYHNNGDEDAAALEFAS